MKQKAIISLLWGKHFGALQQFLQMHEPLTVIASMGSLSPQMQAAIAQTGSTLVSIDGLAQDASAAQTVSAETQQLLGAFERHIQQQPEFCGFAADASDKLRPVVFESVKGDLPAIVQLLECLKRAAEQYDIALLATNEDMTRVGKTATAWARAQGIPSVHLAHSIALVDPYTVHNELIADKLVVYGQRGVEGYRDLGVAAERLIATGNPAWDGYATLRKQKPACRQQLNTKYGLKAELPLVVFGTTWAANLSAHCIEDIYDASVRAFMIACESLKRAGIQINAVIKDRPSNAAFGETRCAEILAKLGASGDGYYYATDDTELFAAGADVLVAVDSNYLVEGMLAHTPVVNLMNTAGMLMGPCFEAETGVVEVEAHELASALQQILTNPELRTGLVQLGQKRAAHYNHNDGDGMATVRVAQVLTGAAKGLAPRMQRHVWQQYLDVESGEIAEGYHTPGRPNLVAMYSNDPAIVIDIGCAAGSTAALIKERFPTSQVWGIEMNRAAAQVASSKIDRVLVGKFEDFDLEREGIAKGTLDGVLLADVLEHMYNPWDVMVKLRPYMSPKGQLVLSIPNVRNLMLMDDLSKGKWTYAAAGLLDITHIRFFTLAEIVKFVAETGYRIVRAEHAIDGRLRDLWNQNQAITAPTEINMDRMKLKDVTRDELLELCTIQFHLVLEKDPLQG
ncbi:methyltransferase domain-containing protein [Paraburkholderia hospita]|uniref:methyltransferase domain-containing protein n=1 Tax=Paraburkholderia hospita TaxID=169430 RepID=UPI0009A802E6|nr:methyltransferase domain-containing protein [Paraburkholderia hospita]SKC53259.1 Methyltransferase domain-containing protein [Paraburkholderia hospita]